MYELGDRKFKPKYNEMDGTINRTSFHGTYNIDKNGYPLNIAGRTGICGRREIDYYGVNHVVDTIVTRWTGYSYRTIELHQIYEK